MLGEGLLGELKRTGDNVGKGLGGSKLSLGIVTTHDLDLNTENSLAEENVANGGVDEVTDGLRRGRGQPWLRSTRLHEFTPVRSGS